MNVVPQFLDIPMLLFIDSKNADMSPGAVFRKNRRDFAADNHVRVMRNRQRSGNAVMIRDRHKIHTTRFCTAIQLLGDVIRFLQNVTQWRDCRIS